MNPTSSPSAASGADRRWKILIAIVAGVFMVILDATVVNVALKTLGSAFNAETGQVQLVVSVYTLALGVATPLAGYLAGRFGTKRSYLSGLALFVAGSVLCGLAPSLPLLVAARVLQGIGGGMALPLGTAQLFRAFPPESRGSALGIFGVALVVAPASGPIIGGALSDAGLWRFIFFLNIPIGLVGLTLANAFLPADTLGRAPKLDIPGFLLAAVGSSALLAAASRTRSGALGAVDPETIGLGLAGLAALIVFVFVELRTAEPLLDLRLFKRRTFAIGNVIGWVASLALFGTTFLLPLYLQIVRGRSALDTGLILLPQALIAGFFSPIAGKLTDRFGARTLSIAGFAILTISSLSLTFLDGSTAMELVVAAMAFRGLAFALTHQVAQVIALQDVSGPKMAVGSSILTSARQVTQAMGVAVLAALVAGTVVVVNGAPDPASYQAGLTLAYWATTVLSAFALGLTLLLPPGRPGAEKAMGEAAARRSGAERTAASPAAV